MVNVLVTGGAGFIGSNFVRYALATHDDWRVTTLDKLTYAGRLENLESVKDHPRHRFVKGDVADAAIAAPLVKASDIVVERRPKAVLGFSDITALLLAVTSRAGVVSFHAPTARQPMTAFSRRHFAEVLWLGEPAGVLERVQPPPEVLVPRSPRIVTLHEGRAEGPLVGGNLSLLQCLIGTPWMPDLDGALLFLEDVGEDLYRVDRMLSHLRLAGLLDRIAGLIVGQFTDMKKGTSDGALGFDEVLEHYIRPLGIPAASGFPIGHVDEQWTLPIGVRGRLDAGAGEVEILEAAVS